MDSMVTLRERLQQSLLHLWDYHRSQAIGLGLGLGLGLCILCFGFWPMLFLALCGGVGLYIGTRVQRGESVIDSALRALRRRFGDDIGRY